MDAAAAASGSNTLVVAVFVLVYLGMAVGRVPGLGLERTGIALIGLIVLLASGVMTLEQAVASADLGALALLFALMILSAQYDGSGFYRLCVDRITSAAEAPHRLLAVLIAVTGALSALLTNDVLVFAMAPLVARGLMQRGPDPRPFLIALAGAANAGSAATLIGNPQNIVIGAAGDLDFWTYSAQALVPTLIALVAVHVAVIATWRGSLKAAPSQRVPAGPAPPIDRWALAKALGATGALVLMFATPLPREVSALAVAGVLLLSRRLSSRVMIAAVDWHLLLLFVCLFAVTEAFAHTGIAQEALAGLAERGLEIGRLGVLSPLVLILSNSIGNVPAVVLFIKLVPGMTEGLYAALAMLSTFAGNLLLTGSMCNIIVAERAQAEGARLGFADFARSGIPMTLAAMAATTAYLAAIGLAPL